MCFTEFKETKEQHDVKVKTRKALTSFTLLCRFVTFHKPHVCRKNCRGKRFIIIHNFTGCEMLILKELKH